MNSVQLAFALLLVTSAYQVDAWWNCRECIGSVTVTVEVQDEDFAGTDNEARRSHQLGLTFFCNARLLGGNASNNVPIEKEGKQALGFDSKTMYVPMNGLIIKGQARTYTADIDDDVKKMCGGCPRPKDLFYTAMYARHSDGMTVKSLSVVANYLDKERTSGLLTLDHHFKNGRLDTTEFPDSAALREIAVKKAGC